MKTTSTLLLTAVLATAALGQTSVTPQASFDTDLAYPARLATTGGGGVLVTDPPSAQVVEYDAVGAVLNIFPIPEGPLGIALHDDGRVFISREDGTIGVYDDTFTLLSTVDPAPMAMVSPNDMAFSAFSGELYVADSGGNAVLVFEESAPDTWTLARAWGMEGEGLGSFLSPEAIALNPLTGHVVVADADNHRVQVFDTTGVLQFKFGYRILYTPTLEVAWFPRPEGLAVDDCGNIFVADALMGTVRAFTSGGVELDPENDALVTFGGGAGQLKVPCDIAIDGSGNMFVASTNTGSVEVFGVTCGLMNVASDDGNSSIRFRRERTGKSRSAMGPQAPDDPIVISEAIHAGRYDRELDLNRDGRLNERDLELAVEAFGIGTVDDFRLTSDTATHPAVDYPHILDKDNRCGRCHSMDGAPEGGITASAGQENLCLSCHSAGKIAGATALGGGDTGMNHAWGVGATPLDANSELNDHLDNGNIRCGTCHAPHDGVNRPNYVRTSADDLVGIKLCGQCHVEYDQWLVAGHADEHADPWSHYDWSQPNRSSCRRCHSGNGYIGHTEGLPASEQNGDFRVADCLVCHATHGKPQAENLLRAYGEATLPTVGPDITLTGLGAEATCYQCHNGRRAPDDGSLTPHYMLGAVMLEGLNGIDFGNGSLSNSAHTSVATCLDCHMRPTPAEGQPGHNKVGGHTFNLVVHDPDDPDFGFENVDNTCNQVGCHNGALTTINRTAFGDYDGDGNIEGVQDEVRELLDIVAIEIQAAGAIQLGGYPYWDFSGVDPADLPTVQDAIWNWEYVDNAGDYGIKNTAYSVGLLQLTYEQLAGQVLPGAALRYTPTP